MIDVSVLVPYHVLRWKRNERQALAAIDLFVQEAITALAPGHVFEKVMSVEDDPRKAGWHYVIRVKPLPPPSKPEGMRGCMIGYNHPGRTR